jgi:hypothetical protein
LISFEAWQDGIVFSSEGMGKLEHSSRHPAIFLGIPRKGAGAGADSPSWKGLGACSLNRTATGRTLLRFASPWEMEFGEEGRILRMRFQPARNAPPGFHPGLMLRFGAPGWDHVYGLGPSPVFDSAGLKLRLDPTSAEGAAPRIPVAFGRKGSWLAVSGGGRLALDFSRKFTEIRSSSLPAELAFCAPGSPADGMAALTAYRAGAGKGRSLRAMPIGPEAGQGAAALLATILSLSFAGEGCICLQIDKPSGHSRNDEDLFRFAAETSAFGLAFPAQPFGQDMSPAQAALYERMSGIFDFLTPYRQGCSESWLREGLPLWSHPCIRYPEDEELWSLDDELMFGPDLLLAPTLERGRASRRLRLPGGEWIHLWTSRRYGPGTAVVDAPIGLPAVFYRRDSRSASLFDDIRKAATRIQA